MEVRYAVVGAGGIGSAAAYWLSRRAGEQVACLEQWAPGHALGASEDHSRIIRLGYHSTDYTALTRAAYGAWAEVEEESGLPLVRRTGMVNVARQGAAPGDLPQDPQPPDVQHEPNVRLAWARAMRIATVAAHPAPSSVC